MNRAFLGLGSNLGDRENYLRQAVATFRDLKAVSGIYETDPIGGPEQDPYLNCVHCHNRKKLINIIDK